MRDKEFFLNQFAQLEARIPSIAKTSRKGLDNRTTYVDSAKYIQWRTQVITLLRQVYPPQLFPKWLDAKVDVASSRAGNFTATAGIFRAAHEDFKNGMLNDLHAEIEGEVVVDYLQQAELLIGDKEDAKYSHIPAAVLTGAVLEKSLRTLCEKQEPHIDVNNDKGKPKKAQRMLDDLKNAGVFTSIEAKQMEAWLAIRNAAAHGKDDEFTRPDVALMIRGVTDFLAKHMR